MRTSTCYVVILMIFEIRLATTSTTIRPMTPPDVGSCQPITGYELKIIFSTVIGKSVSVRNYRTVCTVPGVTRNTVSQYTIYAHLGCYDNCDKRSIYIRLNLMCHNSTKSFRDPTIKAYRGVTSTRLYNPLDFVYSPPSRIDCGLCADFHGNSPGTCHGIYITSYRFELWITAVILDKQSRRVHLL